MKRPQPSKRSSPRVDPPTDTRERILQVAREMIAKRGNAAISLVDVAQQAGVSRQTLYLLFGSRAGLLLALVDQIDRGSGVPRQLAHLRESLPARQALTPYVRAWLDYLPIVFPVARALSAAATTGDADAHAAWESRMKLLRAGLVQITQGLHATGDLRDGWTPATAAEWIFSLTHVDMWQHLVVESKWKPAAMMERIMATLHATLLRDGSGHTPERTTLS
jgi:AcrR family transcriptional regulator